MKFASSVLLAVLTAVLAPAIHASGGALGAEQKPQQETEKSAAAWLELVDAGQYAKSWEEAAAYFKGAVSKENWQKALEAHRRPLGKLGSRKLTDATFAKTLPGAPDGQYVVMKYETSFEKKKSAVETVTFMLDIDGKWRAAGYFIR